jgi:hypothetical protein
MHIDRTVPPQEWPSRPTQDGEGQAVGVDAPAGLCQPKTRQANFICKSLNGVFFPQSLRDPDMRNYGMQTAALQWSSRLTL